MKGNKFMKKTAALLALLAIFAISGCNSDNKKPDSQTGNTTTTADENKVSEVAFKASERELVSDEALHFLSENVPLYSKYVQKRMSIPIILETKITSDSGTLYRNLYIKEDESVSTYAKNYDGSESTVIYALSGCYFIENSTSTAYKFSYKENVIKDQMKQFQYSITMDSLKAVTETASDATATYNGEEYNIESITDDTGKTTYYFDKKTEELRYIVSGDTVTEILKLQAANPDEKYFKIPDGFAVKDFNEYAASAKQSSES